MKTLINYLLILSLTINSAFGFGGVVTDPTSYTYYAKEIKAMNDAIKTSLDQLEQINKLNDLAKKTNQLIDDSGKLIYNPTKQIQGIVSGLQKTSERFKSIGEKVNNLNAEHFLKDYHRVEDPLKDDIYEKWLNNFEGLFDNTKDDTYIKLKKKVDNAIKNKNYTAWEKARADLDNYLNLKRIERDKLKKYALLAPVEYYNNYYLHEDSIERRKQREENIQRLIKQINSAQDVFKQQQTTNEILIELLYVVQAQYELQMKYYNSVNLTLLNKDVENKAYDMQKVREERESFNSRSAQKIQTDQLKQLDKWYQEKNDIGKHGFIYKMLDIHNN